MNESTRTLVRGWLILVAIFVVILWSWRTGIGVSVRNDETFTVRDVMVHTSAGAYPLGDLEPGDSESTTVGANGESSVSVAWLDAAGLKHEHDADVYIEGTPAGVRPYAGTIDFEIAADSARCAKSLRMSLSPFSRATPPPAR